MLAFACLEVHLVVPAGDVPDGLLTSDYPNFKAVMAVQKDITPALMKLDGVHDTAVGQDDTENPVLVI